MNQANGLPMRKAWDGSHKYCSYEELKVNSGQDQASAMPSLLENQELLAEKISKITDKKNSRKFYKNPIRENLKK